MPRPIFNQNSINGSHKLEQEHILSAKRAVLLFVFFCFFEIIIAFVVFFPLGIYGGIQVSQGHLNPTEMQHFLEKLHFPVAILSTVVSAIIIFFMTKKTLRGSVSDGAFACLGWKKVSLSHTILGFVVGIFLAIGVAFVIIPAIPPVNGQEFGFNGTAAGLGGWQRFYWAITALIVAPLIEEFICRGVLFTGISNTYGVYVSAITVSLLFVVMHIPEAIYYWPMIIGVSLLSIATIIFRIKTKSLFPAIAVHFGYNFSLVIFVYTDLHIH